MYARHLKPAGIKLGMPWLAWHCFRRAAATAAQMIHMDLSDRMALLGHSRGTQTMEYERIDSEGRRGAIDALAKKMVN